MKPEYTLVKNSQGTYELRSQEYIVALFFDDGTFTRIPFVPADTGIKVDEEGKIKEDHSVSTLGGKPIRDHASHVSKLRRFLGVL